MKKILLSFLFASLFFCASAKADTIYTYTGLQFNFFEAPPGARTEITAVVDLSAPLGNNLTLGYVTPLSFEMSDGVTTISGGLNATSYGFEASTDSSGNIVDWDVSSFCGLPDCGAGSGGYWGLATRNIPNGTGVIDWSYTGALNDLVGVLNDPGKWTSTDPVATPEPSTLILLSSGLIALGFAKRKVFQK
jgi:hypothetical protein